MPSTATLHVAIFNDESVYKHWAFFVDGPTNAQKIILNAMGSSTRYYFEMTNTNARDSKILSELVYLCDVDASEIGRIIEAGKNAIIHNEFPGYNCQDYVLELLNDLESKRIIDGADANYQKHKAAVQAKQEGLV
jgi:hypothetical protein